MRERRLAKLTLGSLRCLLLLILLPLLVLFFFVVVIVFVMLFSCFVFECLFSFLFMRVRMFSLGRAKRVESSGFRSSVGGFGALGIWVQG